MSAAAPNSSTLSDLIKREIRLEVWDFGHWSRLVNKALAENNDDMLKAARPATDEEFLDFFVLAIAKELKSIFSSEVAPEYWRHRGFSPQNYFTDTKPYIATNLTNNYKIHGLNAMKKNERPDKFEDEMMGKKFLLDVLSDSYVVLTESLKAVYYGRPLDFFNYDQPTTLFLYYRMDGEAPIYSGHIFVQPSNELDPTVTNTFFVSIYRSIFERFRGFSSRVIDDVEVYARAQGHKSIFTIPLTGMIPILKKKGFVIKPKGERNVVKDDIYIKYFSSTNEGAVAGAGATGGRRKTLRRYRHRGTRRYHG